MGRNLLQGLGQAQPVTGFINEALKYQGVNAETDLRRQETANLAQRERMFKLQENELQRKQEDENRLINLDDIPTKFAVAGMGSTGKALQGYASALGSVQEVPAPDGTVKRFIRKGDLIQSMQDYDGLAKHAPQHVLAMGWAGYEDAKSKLDALQGEAAKGKPVNPVDVEAAKKTADVALANYREVHRLVSGKEPPKPNVYKPNDFIQQPDGSFVQMPGNETEQWSEPFSGNVGGKEILLRKSLKTGKVEQVSAGPAATTVNVGVNTGLEKGARAEAQKEVQTGADLIAGLKQMSALTEPEFLTYTGQLRAGAAKVGEKTGLAADSEFLKAYTAWKTNVEQQFNLYRKAITGVAAGPKELEMIRKTFPNSDMAGSEFQAAIKETAVTAWKLMERRRRALAAGIMDERRQKDFYQLIPLDSMPNPPAEFMAQFSGASGAPKTAEEYFQKKGR